MPLFTTLNADRMCQLIAEARFHVVLAAPGITLAIAHALEEASQRLGNDAVQVVLDVSARVARLGFGEYEAIELLQKTNIALHHHPGLRIGALICDDAGWSFATSPKLVEADPSSDSSAFNAITLTEAQVLVLRAELPTVRAKNYTQYKQPELIPDYPLVGTERVSGETVVQVKRALAIAPPQPFDLARQTQVYAALIQFVELSFEGFNIQSRRVQLPKSLPLIASKDKAVKERLTASLKVLDRIEKPKILQEITERLEELRNAYLIPVGQAGRVILKSKRADFEQELRVIEEALNACKEGLLDDLNRALDSVMTAIVPDLARAVLADPPARFRGLFPLTEEAAHDYVISELSKSLPTAETLIAGMKIHKFYKDVTYETLKNEEFAKRVMQEIPRSVLDGALLQERVAAEAGEITK